MKHPIVVGLQYGDEGKGKITDILAQKADWVIRFNGGNNAGHTIKIGNQKIVTHSVPSGVLYPQAKNFIGAGCVVDPVALMKECEEIRASGVSLGPDRLKVDYRAHLTLPLHRALDRAREQTRQGVGTTQRGIGPTYVTKVDRLGIRVGDLWQESLQERLKALMEIYAEKDVEESAFTFDENWAALKVAQEGLKDFVSWELTPFYEAFQKQRCLLEGAQGVLLDIDHGIYPYVTSSCTLASSAAAGTPFPLSGLGPVLGVAKAYLTRVGQGPLKTELFDEVGERIRKKGGEFGATTGRPRRIGWLDLDELKMAVRLTDCTAVVLSKADVLVGESRVGVLHRGSLEFLPGWQDMWRVPGEKLSQELETFLQKIEAVLGIPVVAVGTGMDRKDLFWRQAQPACW